MTVDAAKSALRERARDRRRLAAREAGPGAGRLIADFAMALLPTIALPPRPVVAGYWPAGSEADVRPLLERASGAGLRCALPVVESRSTPLSFRAWRPGAELVDGALGTRQPDDGCETVRPDVVLTPLLAFDAAGYRLGLGGGYYDRTLAALRAAGRVAVIGIGFAGQRMDAVPREDHDQRLDWIVTEAGVLTVG